MEIDVTKQLRRGVMFKMHGEMEAQWFFIKYERLPNFCYACGLLGHGGGM